MSTHIHSNQRGFTLIELMVGTAITLLVVGTALTAFTSAVKVTQSGTSMADANQNLRAGTNQLIRDLMMAGRVIGPEGIPMPSGAGLNPFLRPTPPIPAGSPATQLNFDLIVNSTTTLNLPDISTGEGLGPIVNGEATDIVTIMTVDEFTPVLMSPPAYPGSPGAAEAVIDPAAGNLTLPTNSQWLALGAAANDTSPIVVGDLIFFKSPTGTAIQTVTRTDPTHIYFDSGDWFQFNQRGGVAPVLQMKLPQDSTSAWTQKVSLFRAVMITYYVDNVTTPGSPRLTRVENNFGGQALAGVVEDLKLTYDVADGFTNPVGLASLPITVGTQSYAPNQIRKVNLHVGVRSESKSPITQDYIRNHVSTAVDVRSLASVDRYVQ